MRCSLLSPWARASRVQLPLPLFSVETPAPVRAYIHTQHSIPDDNCSRGPHGSVFVCGGVVCGGHGVDCAESSELISPSLHLDPVAPSCVGFATAPPRREEFTRHGMDDIVTLTHRNVCKDGFTVADTVDAGTRTARPPGCSSDVSLTGGRTGRFGAASFNSQFSSTCLHLGMRSSTQRKHFV